MSFFQIIVGRDAWEPEAEEAQNSIAAYMKALDGDLGWRV